jgi:hypothetical protein
MKIQIKGVYYLESQNPNMNPIAIRPELTLPNYVAWEDTGHGRILRFKKVLADRKEILGPIEKIPDKIEIISEDNQIYTLVKLTNQIFNEKLKGLVAGGETLNFKTDEELQEYYLTADFYSAG